MKVAIFHNALDNIGGAELVDLIMARELDADIYTTNIDQEKIKKLGFTTNNIYSIGKVPINAPFRQEAIYWRFRFLDVEKIFKKKYDCYIIAGDWAMAGAIHNKPHFWYVYSPTRELYDLYPYLRKKVIAPWQRPLFDCWVIYRRIINQHDIKKVKKIIAISNNVSQRIKKYLKRKSKVIYPPIETKDYYTKNSQGYWLSVNRLFKHKRVHLQIEAFQKMPDKKLIIVGSYEASRHFKEYAAYIKKIKPKNVEIKSWINKKELLKLYAECIGLLATAKDEDYGLSPLEAMAAGKPVIAADEGGYKETITKNTGIVIKEINQEKIVKAVKEIEEKLNQDPTQFIKSAREQAKKFDTKIFIEKIKEEIEQCKNQN